MKAKSLLLIISLIITLCGFQNTEKKKLPLFVDNFKTEVSDGMFINCRKIQDLTVVMPISEQMKSYDIFKLELHRFGEDIDIIAGSKIFDTKSKEFLKKQSTKESLNFKVLEKEGEFAGTDLEPNTMLFAGQSSVTTVFCDSHDLKHCSFYLVVRGYNKTGELTQFGEDVFDKGTDLTAKSVMFKSWIDRTVR